MTPKAIHHRVASPVGTNFETINVILTTTSCYKCLICVLPVEVTCPPPPSPMYARVSVSSMAVGSVAVYTCDAYYRLTEGSTNLTCLHSGSWGGRIPACSG